VDDDDHMLHSFNIRPKIAGSGLSARRRLLVHIGIRRGLYTIVWAFSTLAPASGKSPQSQGNRSL
jgi:hypothetical protein